MLRLNTLLIKFALKIGNFYFFLINQPPETHTMLSLNLSRSIFLPVRALGLRLPPLGDGRLWCKGGLITDKMSTASLSLGLVDYLLGCVPDEDSSL
jgi:hypothetical protein